VVHQLPIATANCREGSCHRQSMEAMHEGSPQASTLAGLTGFSSEGATSLMGGHGECSFKDLDLAHFVTQAVHGQLAALGNRYEAVRSAMQSQIVQDQLTVQTESYRQLERDSFLLRQQVEAMTQHIAAHRQRMVSQQSPLPTAFVHIPPPAHIPPPPGLETVRPSSPFQSEGSHGTVVAQAEVMSEQLPASSQLNAPAGAHNPWATFPPQKGLSPEAPLSDGDVAGELRNILAATQQFPQLQHAAANLGASAAGSDSPHRCTTPPINIENQNGSRSSTPSTAVDVSFNITLRRSDDMPLGIEVQPNVSRKFLAVERVLPGSVVEAWNRQCAGELREIRPGDRVISVNGFEDVELMRGECVNKRVLKLALVRPGATEDSISEMEDEDASV